MENLPQDPALFHQQLYAQIPPMQQSQGILSLKEIYSVISCVSHNIILQLTEQPLKNIFYIQQQKEHLIVKQV